jgi:hypothetical protein
MRFMERRHDEDGDALPPWGGGAGGGALESLRQDGNAFLAAGDKAINHAMSINSEKYVSATRQQGGQ